MRYLKLISYVLIVFIIGTLLFIWSNSMKTGEVSKGQSQNVAQVIQPIVDPEKTIPENEFIAIIRKCAHFTEFTILGCELMLLRLLAKKPQMFTVLFIALSAAVVDESIQLLSDRGDQVSDILLDFGGAVFGVAAVAGIYLFVACLIKKLRHVKKAVSAERNRL